MANNHQLTEDEKRISADASKKLGFEVIVFQDGRWICDPRDTKKNMGFGISSDEAIRDCRINNEERMAREYCVEKAFINGRWKVRIQITDWEIQSDIGYTAFQDSLNTIGL